MEREQSWADAHTEQRIALILKEGVAKAQLKGPQIEKWKDFEFSAGQLKSMNDFHDFLKIRGLKPNSRLGYLYFLRDLARFTKKEYKRLDKKDLISFFAYMQGHSSAFHSNTWKIYAKRYFQWAYGMPKGKYPKLVQGEEFDKVKTERTIREEELLTDQEMHKMLETTTSARDRLILSLLGECGMRVGELVEIKIGDISFKEGYAVVQVSGKTGEREIVVVRCANQLREFVNNHPSKEPEDWLFWEINRKKGQKTSKTKPLERHSVYMMVNRTAQRAGLKKRVYPHLFRFTCASRDIQFLTSEEMKSRFGWAKMSNMPAHYSAVKQTVMRNKLLAFHGVKIQKNENGGEDFAECPRCHMRNSRIDRFCNYCDAPLEVKAVVEQKRAEDRINEKIDALKDTYAKSVRSEFDEIRKEIAELKKQRCF